MAASMHVSSNRSGRTRRVAVLAACAGLVAAVLVDARPAVAACPPGSATASGAATVAQTPWPQARFDLATVAQITDGSGVTVAVVDSGVDATHPQLTNAVDDGTDVLRGTGDGREDCLGHGTAVASIVAAQPVDGVGLRGLAPGVRVIPIRVSERIQVDGTVSGAGTVLDLANGILAAVDTGARVINLSISTPVDHPALRDAITTALAADIVVVAAAGNHEAAGGSAVPYPAGYDGVVGVGAINATGERVATSPVGSYVDIVAPGDGIVGAVPGGGYAVGLQGTSFATPFVAATAALIRARWPELDRSAVVRRLLATADPASGSAAAYGAGVVNPLRALTEVLGPAGEIDKVAPISPGPIVLASGAGPRPHALALAAGLVLAAAAVTAVAAAVPLGRRRRWHPGDQ